jgi:hypothetical protein
MEMSVLPFQYSPATVTRKFPFESDHVKLILHHGFRHIKRELMTRITNLLSDFSRTSNGNLYTNFPVCLQCLDYLHESKGTCLYFIITIL